MAGCRGFSVITPLCWYRIFSHVPVGREVIRLEGTCTVLCVCTTVAQTFSLDLRRDPGKRMEPWTPIRLVHHHGLFEPSPCVTDGPIDSPGTQQIAALLAL
jgi:hypothetical protein